MGFVFIYNEDSIIETKAGTGTGGTVDVDFDAVPSGYYYHILALTGRQPAPVLTQVIFCVVRDAAVYYLDADGSPVAGVASTCSRELFLKAGDVLRVRFVGTTAGKTLTCDMNARKIPAS